MNHCHAALDCGPVPPPKRSPVSALETLTEEQLARIEDAVPAGEVAGDRYPAAHMAALDSER